MLFCRAPRTTVLLLCAAASASACGTGDAAPARTSTPTPAAATPRPSSSPTNAYGHFTFSGWLNASNVGPVQPLPFATPAGEVPGVPPTQGAGGLTVTGSAPGTQCFHASSRGNIDQYEALLVFLVRGQRYLLSIADAFERPGQALGEATPPAGSRLTDVGGNVDELHFDPEGVRLSDDPMFLASYSDGAVVLAPNLRSGSVDVTFKGLAGAGSPLIHVTGSFVCP